MTHPSAPLQYGWHCAYDIHYHFVFVVKYRKSLLDKEVVAHLMSISQEIAERYEIEVENLGTDSNHIHLLCCNGGATGWLRGTCALYYQPGAKARGCQPQALVPGTVTFGYTGACPSDFHTPGTSLSQ